MSLSADSITDTTNGSIEMNSNGSGTVNGNFARDSTAHANSVTFSATSNLTGGQKLNGANFTMSVQTSSGNPIADLQMSTSGVLS
jgi:hypothetical protein